jgi:purine-nucleoside phosphorylase
MSISTVAAIREAIEAIETAVGDMSAPLGMVLGSGLGKIADELEDRRMVSYDKIPHIPSSTVPGHAGSLVRGKWQGREVVMLSGRVHKYEGHTYASVALPVQLLGAMGVDVLVLTNAAGAVNPAFSPGDMMLIEDHLNLTGGNPLEGRNDPRIGPRFPDMTEVYDVELRRMAVSIADRLGLKLQRGVYASVLGPSYETPAEIRMVRAIGGDAVGMSTVPEAIAARHMGMRVLGLSCISNYGAGMGDDTLDHSHVAEVAGRATEGMQQLLATLVRELPPLSVRQAVVNRISGAVE